MATTCTPQALAAASECLNLSLPEGVREAIKTYLLAVQAGGSTNAITLLAQAKAAGWCGDTIPPQDQKAAQLYMLALDQSTTLQPAITAAACFDLEPSSSKSAGTIFLLADGNTVSTDPATLVGLATTNKFLCGMDVSDMLAIQSMLIASITANAGTPQSILNSAACYSGIGSGLMAAMEEYLWCLFFSSPTPPPASDALIDVDGTLAADTDYLFNFGTLGAAGDLFINAGEGAYVGSHTTPLGAIWPQAMLVDPNIGTGGDWLGGNGYFKTDTALSAPVLTALALKGTIAIKGVLVDLNFATVYPLCWQVADPNLVINSIVYIANDLGEYVTQCACVDPSDGSYKCGIKYFYMAPADAEVHWQIFTWDNTGVTDLGELALTATLDASTVTDSAVDSTYGSCVIDGSVTYSFETSKGNVTIKAKLWDRVLTPAEIAALILT